MGWFEKQITERLSRDNEKVRDANLRLSSIVMGNKVFANAIEAAGNSEGEILKFYKVSSLNQLAQRNVHLTDGWWKDCIGAMLAKTADGKTIALIPYSHGGYTYYDSELGKRVKVSSKTPIPEQVISFYLELPQRSLSLKDLFLFGINSLHTWDIIYYLLFMLAGVLMGMFFPYINSQLFSKVIPSGQYSQLIAITILMACVIISTTLINICSSLSSSRIMTKIDTTVSPAVYMRLLSLPVSFFKNFTSGELAERSGAIKSLSSIFFGSILSTFITFVFSIVYLFQIDSISPEMNTVVVLVLSLILIISLANTYISVKITGKKMKSSAKLSGLIFHLIGGIEKIKLTGSEKRAYSKWADLYGEKAGYTYNPPLLMKIGGTLNTSISLLGSILFYAIGAKNGMLSSEYMAFIVAYGLLSGGVLSLGNIVSAAAQLRPNYEMARPILEAIPENYTEKETLVHGIDNIELSHVNFRYTPDTPFIFNDLNLKIKKGEYLGIVGKTGCGKSTLVRLILGFEKPEEGAIYINGINMNEVDCKSLRKKMGVVMQTSKLFPGDIFSNISATNPEMTRDDAWAVAKMVGIDGDIKAMPMGMQTLITEGGGGLSGGQRQRLIIARAVASHPDVVIFDEATSALDNITQKQVSDSLDELKCTKIAIAHRLSTIKHCDRIIVIDDGKIVEEGNYEFLMKKNGYFSELVKRQV